MDYRIKKVVAFCVVPQTAAALGAVRKISRLKCRTCKKDTSQSSHRAAQGQNFESIHLIVPLSAVRKIHVAMSNLIKHHQCFVIVPLSRKSAFTKWANTNQERSLRCSCICHMSWKLHKYTAAKKATVSMPGHPRVKTRGQKYNNNTGNQWESQENKKSSMRK